VSSMDGVADPVSFVLGVLCAVVSVVPAANPNDEPARREPQPARAMATATSATPTLSPAAAGDICS